MLAEGGVVCSPDSGHNAGARGPYPPGVDAREIIDRLGLRPHPEGGWYAETWRADAAPGERPVGSAIYFLLQADELSRWHRVDAAEAWHFYAGHPLELKITQAGSPAETHVLGIDLAAGQRPQAIVPAGAWQTARPLGEWTLVGCTVSPAFDFDRFALAPEDWQPTNLEG